MQERIKEHDRDIRLQKRTPQTDEQTPIETKTQTETDRSSSEKMNCSCFGIIFSHVHEQCLNFPYHAYSFLLCMIAVIHPVVTYLK